MIGGLCHDKVGSCPAVPQWWCRCLDSEPVSQGEGTSKGRKRGNRVGTTVWFRNDSAHHISDLGSNIYVVLTLSVRSEAQCLVGSP